MDFPRLLSQIVIQNSRQSCGSLCSRLWKPSCDSAQLFIQRRIHKQNVWTRLLTLCWRTALKMIWTLGPSTSPSLNFTTTLQDTLLLESLHSHWFMEETPIRRYPLPLMSLNHKWTLLRPCWSLFILPELMQKTACPLHRHNKPNFTLNTGILVVSTLETYSFFDESQWERIPSLNLSGLDPFKSNPDILP